MELVANPTRITILIQLQLAAENRLSGIHSAERL